MHAVMIWRVADFCTYQNAENAIFCPDAVNKKTVFGIDDWDGCFGYHSIICKVNLSSTANDQYNAATLLGSLAVYLEYGFAVASF